MILPYTSIETFNLKMQQTLPNGIPSNDPSLPDLDTPLYVLVNSNTASAAEVLAAALKVLNSTL